MDLDDVPNDQLRSLNLLRDAVPHHLSHEHEHDQLLKSGLHQGQRRGHLGKALHDLPGPVLLVVGEQDSHYHHYHKSNPIVEVVVSLQIDQFVKTSKKG